MNKETARKSGAIEVLARIVNRYAEQISVCKNGISALNVLITKDDGHKRALDSGVIEASANAIHAQQKDPEVCRMGCQIIWSILMKGNKYEATEKTIRTIIEILKRHGKIASIERPSVEILKRQRRNTNNANVIRKEFFHDPELRVYFLKLYGRDIILVVLVLVLTALAVFYFNSMRKK